MSVDPKAITYWTCGWTDLGPKLMGGYEGRVCCISLSELATSPRHQEVLELLARTYPREVITPDSLEVYGDPVPEAVERVRDLTLAIRGAVFDLSVVRDLLEADLSGEALEVVKYAMARLAKEFVTDKRLVYQLTE